MDKLGCNVGQTLGVPCRSSLFFFLSGLEPFSDLAWKLRHLYILVYYGPSKYQRTNFILFPKNERLFLELERGLIS
jgi:hypothetical protein